MAVLTIVIIIVVVILFFFGMRVVRPTEKGLVERLGKYKKTAEQGFHWIIPLIDRMIKVNITENMIDIEPQTVITRDDLNATVDAVIYFRVLDPKKAVYHADDYWSQITSLARTTLRDIIGKMTLSDANSKRDELNSRLEKELDAQTDAWGIDVIRVELQRIEPPQDVQNAMNQVVKAEREKIAANDFASAQEIQADGEKRSAIKVAEGSKRAAILEAEGQSQAIVNVANAKSKEIEMINTSIIKHFKGEAITYKKLETAESALRDGTKYVIDSNSNIMNVMSDIAGVMPVPSRRPAKKR